MRLSILAALGIAAVVGIMTIDAPDANALVRRTTVVSGPRGAVVVSRSRGMRTATVVRRGRGRGVRTAAIARGPRGAVVIRRRRF
jgi:hypothetical protein